MIKSCETHADWHKGDTVPETATYIHTLHLPEAPISAQFLFLAEECESVRIDVHTMLNQNVDRSFVEEFLAQHLREIHTEAKQLIDCLRDTKTTATADASRNAGNIRVNLATLEQHEAALRRWARSTLQEKYFCLSQPSWYSQSPMEESIDHPHLLAA